MKRDTFLAAGIAAFWAGTSLVIAEERRELSAHVHGHSNLNIAMEGSSIAMEFTAPAADIVGFEHPPHDDADKAAVEAAIASLSDPLAHFTLPEAAGCSLQSHEVAFVTDQDEGHGHDEHHDDEEHADDDHAHDEHAHDEHEYGEAGHAEFRAEYVIACEDMAAADSLEVRLFDAFANAQEVEVNAIGASGQVAFEADSDNRTIDLSGVL